MAEGSWRTANPFTPSFGVSPPLLVGRRVELEAFSEAFQGGPGSPYRAVLVSGRRGTGKTVLLNAVEDLARSHGWSVVSTTLRTGTAEQIADTLLPEQLRQHPVAFERYLTNAGLSAAGFGASVGASRVERFPVKPDLRLALTTLADAVAEANGGVLITIDEIGAHAKADLQQITQAVQHCFREGRPVALLAAGLPQSIADVLDTPGATFIRRAERFQLGPLALDQVREAIQRPILDAGRGIDQDAIAAAVIGTEGYPFMIQMIGYQAWASAEEADTITREHADAGVLTALRRMSHLVIEPALGDVSEKGRDFLAAMAEDDGPSRISDIAQRLGVDGNYANTYRARLLAAEVIRVPARGYVDFTIPGMRLHLREHHHTEPEPPPTSPGAPLTPPPPAAERSIDPPGL